VKKKKINEHSKQIERLISKKIRESMDDFKRSFVPKGWAVVNISSFAKDMAREIVDSHIVLNKTK